MTNNTNREGDVRPCDGEVIKFINLSLVSFRVCKRLLCLGKGLELGSIEESIGLQFDISVSFRITNTYFFCEITVPELD